MQSIFLLIIWHVGSRPLGPKVIKSTYHYHSDYTYVLVPNKWKRNKKHVWRHWSPSSTLPTTVAHFRMRWSAVNPDRSESGWHNPMRTTRPPTARWSRHVAIRACLTPQTSKFCQKSCSREILNNFNRWQYLDNLTFFSSVKP